MALRFQLNPFRPQCQAIGGARALSNRADQIVLGIRAQLSFQQRVHPGFVAEEIAFVHAIFQTGLDTPVVGLADDQAVFAQERGGVVPVRSGTPSDGQGIGSCRFAARRASHA